MNTIRTRIKFCGITSPADARAAVKAGADAIGLVFHPDSSRYVSLEQARQIADVVPAFVSIVGLFVNPSPETVVTVQDALRIDLLQFHGEEDESFCASFSRPYMKALRVRPGLDLVAAIAAYPRAAAILLDTWDDSLAGGSGKGFDWAQISADVSRERLVLAGGLDPDNVASAIAAVAPYAVDVSSGIEAAPGQKSAEKMQRFTAAVNSTWR